MRIISGRFKGKRISAPQNLPVRPTTDYAKESLFNILNNTFHLDDCAILDCFSGTGNISYEFLSRGVKSVLSLDINAKCINFQKKIKQELNCENFTPVNRDVFKALKDNNLGTYDIIFCDPPYDLPNISEIADIVLNADVLTCEGWLIIEHGKSTMFNHINYKETRKYGNVNFSIFQRKDD